MGRMGGKTRSSLLILICILVEPCLLCQVTLPVPIPVAPGTVFCATQSCSHIYNFRPCREWNKAECDCTATDATCPGGYTMDADGQKCFILRKGQSSWSDANTRCQNEEDTGLAIITSANENTAVQTVVTSANGKAYIGLTDSATEMTWLWTDGSAMSYSPGWINNQPATQTIQNCVVMRDQGVNIGKWQHVGCDKTVGDNINFVCERKTEC